MNSKKCLEQQEETQKQNFMIKSDSTHSRIFRKQKYDKQKTPILQNQCKVKPVNEHTLYSYFFNILF